MKFKWTAALAAIALATAPTAALARGHGGHYGGHGGYYGGGHGYYGHGHYHGDALAAGVVGLAFGLALGAAASDHGCYDRCGGYGYRDSYYGRGYYAPPPPPQGCITQAQTWDPYAGQYVWVNVRVPC